MDVLNKIKGFDLNLLSVFVAIDEHRHITKAAKILGITQPALSHALGRLRLLLHDELFVKTSKGMVPTPKATELSQPIRSMLTHFERDVLGTETFDPKNMKRVFKISTTDLIESLLFPSLLKMMNDAAPLAQIISRPSAFSLPREELESGLCDIAIAGFFGDLPEGFYQQKLFTDGFMSAVRKGHPKLGKKNQLSIEDFCSESHLLIAPGGELSSKVDELLKKKKAKRVIAGGLQSFMSSAWVLRETDCILTAPTRLIKQIEKAFPLCILAPPVAITPITIVQVWHKRNNGDSAHKWLRENIRQTLQVGA